MSSNLIPEVSILPLVKRGLSAETCEKFGYGVSVYGSKPVQVAPYRDTSGAIVAQHVRFPNKDFIWLGDAKKVGLWGEHLWRDGGRMVVVTEGEIDCMTVSQLQGNKWPVVSIPSGAQGARRAIQQSLEWLEKFESVVFMFDMDEPGRAAALECAQILSPGRAKIAQLTLKDANEMHLAGRGKEVLDAAWGAKVYRPDGIVTGEDLWGALTKNRSAVSLPYPWNDLNRITRGQRSGELVTWTAGTGIGKSAFVREVAHALIQRGEKVGYIALEESMQRTLEGLLGISLNRRLNIDRSDADEGALRAALDAMKENLALFDHWGSSATDHLLSRIRYMARGLGCSWVILDHISIVVSGIDEGDERRTIDNLMTALRGLVAETKIGMHLVSHLKRPQGAGHEEGAQTSLAQLRGSAAIGQLSDFVIGVERNQQHEDPAMRNVSTLRVLKNRFTGETGPAGCLRFDDVTGRLYECEPLFSESGPAAKPNTDFS
jgi:twinkle protein